MTRASHPDLSRSYAVRWVGCQKALPVDQGLSPSPWPQYQIEILRTTAWIPTAIAISVLLHARWPETADGMYPVLEKETGISHLCRDSCIILAIASACHAITFRFIGKPHLISALCPEGALFRLPVFIYRASSDGCCVSNAYSTAVLELI